MVRGKVRHRNSGKPKPVEHQPTAKTVADIFRQHLLDNPPSEHPVYGGCGSAGPQPTYADFRAALARNT